jgi:hypothetical protein
MTNAPSRTTSVQDAGEKLLLFFTCRQLLVLLCRCDTCPGAILVGEREWLARCPSRRRQYILEVLNIKNELRTRHMVPLVESDTPMLKIRGMV